MNKDMEVNEWGTRRKQSFMNSYLTPRVCRRRDPSCYPQPHAPNPNNYPLPACAMPPPGGCCADIPPMLRAGWLWTFELMLCETLVLNGSPRPGAGSKWASERASQVSSALHTPETANYKLKIHYICGKTWIYLDKSRWGGWIISLHFSTLHFIQKKWNITHYAFFSFHLLSLP